MIAIALSWQAKISKLQLMIYSMFNWLLFPSGRESLFFFQLVYLGILFRQHSTHQNKHVPHYKPVFSECVHRFSNFSQSQEASTDYSQHCCQTTDNMVQEILSFQEPFMPSSNPDQGNPFHVFLGCVKTVIGKLGMRVSLFFFFFFF